MASHHQGLLGGDDTQQRRGLKVALIPLGLFFLAIVSTRFSTDKDAATSLVGLASPMTGRMPTMLRSGGAFGPASMAVQAAQNQLKMYGIRPSPIEISALNVVDLNSRQRDVSANAKAPVSGWDLIDPDTRTRLVEILDEVKNKDMLLAGVSAPMNYFDPLMLSTTVDGAKLLFYREVELKHGRVAMLAALGIIVGENFHPLFGGDIDVPAYLAFQQTPLQKFWPAVVTALSIPEVFSIFQFKEPKLTGRSTWEMKLDHAPGDLGFDPLGLKPKDPAELKEMMTKELNNGRLAMIAVAGMIGQEIATGQKIF